MKYQQARWADDGRLEPLVFELSKAKRTGYTLPPKAPSELNIPSKLIRAELDLPELSEPEVVRHYTRLSQMNYGVDSGFYPLGSCTMKYNPKICEELAALETASCIHPYQAEDTVQGALELMYKLERYLAEITGVARVCLHPSAGAHGEFLGMLLVRAYHKFKKKERTEVIVPDSAHGTNFASAAMAGFNVVVIPSNNRGRVDIEALRKAVSKKTAALMLTNPNTLGLFEDEILEIAEAVHKVGGLLYYDGANLNGILGKARPGDMGFDIVHFNLHKTFATPHGGGGPGAGPVGVTRKLEKFLPVPVIEYDRRRKRYYLDYDRPHSIGKIKGFYGNFGVLVKAYAYILLMGADGLREAAEAAVLNANYLMHKIRGIGVYGLKFDTGGPRKHEVVFSAELLKRETGVTAREVAKRLLDYGTHAPTYYFPPIVPEALMIEPTETETKEELDRFVAAMGKIAEEARSNPEKLRAAPTTTAIGRLDEVKASREPILSWRMYRKQAGR
ncbi:MAG: glycine dehydrogenase (aminomethyl-transferring) [Hadesarchaea archaeon CG08_land_8_20_14_0_20_51_8]|nr:MAG: glycine dehydrogenase (aminomethyl-transferring) [Hadesarchaea archaeon CG08_land_8_20_14_0_20_51_8]